jgi:signal transduction histidine kinase
MARILIVDDEEDIRNIFQYIVSNMGHDVYVAKNAEEAKLIINTEEDLDAALVDRILPGKEDGLDILGYIKIHQPLCQSILVSGYPTFNSASEALRYSAFDYLTKPVKEKELSQVIDAAVKEKIIQKQKDSDAGSSKKAFEELMSKQELLQHDMRSLVVGITGFANLLLNRTPLNGTQIEYCQQIQQCSIQLESMINVYMDIANLELKTSVIKKSRLNMLDIIQKSRKTLQFLADEKSVEISLIYNKKMLLVTDDLAFHGNRVYLQNAINNLLKNAIEASPSDHGIEIKLVSTANDIHIYIHNWGAVPEDILPKFFKKFVSSGKSGFGLGTYMADLAIKAHKGRIDVLSSKDEGTEIAIKLPILKNP